MHVESKFSMLSKTSSYPSITWIPSFCHFPSSVRVTISTSLQEDDSAEHKNTDQTVTSVYIYITFFQPPWHFLLLSENTQKSPQTHNHQTITCNLSTRKFCIIILPFPPPISHSLQKQRLAYTLPDSVNASALLRVFWRDADLFVYNASS